VWIIYSGLATDPFIAAQSDGRRRMVSNDLDAIRQRLQVAGLCRFGRRIEDPFHVVEIWAVRRAWAYHVTESGAGSH
jgi:hypothetical protein